MRISVQKKLISSAACRLHTCNGSNDLYDSWSQPSVMSACSFPSQTLKLEVQDQTQKHQQKNKSVMFPLVLQSPFTNQSFIQQTLLFVL